MSFALAFCAASVGAGVAAADFRTTSDQPTVLYDGPSTKSRPQFLYGRDVPVEVIVSVEGWIKVRDAGGTIGWIERKSLGDKRMLLVTGPTAEARARPEEGAPAAFSAAQNVTLELIEVAPNGWLRVRHADGATGYVRAAQVWGN